MNKIYNELEYALNLMENGFTKFMSGIDLNILAKYYRSIGMNNAEIKKEMISFCIKYDSKFNKIIYEGKIDKIIKRSSKYELRMPIDVPITESEVKKIKELNNFRYEKIVFVMLVMAKYNKLINKSKYDNYYFSGKLPSVYRMAHVSQMKGENIAHILYNAGYVEDSQRKDNFKIKFTDINDISVNKIIVTDMNDIYKFWKQACEICGCEIDKKSKKQIYCSACAKNNEKKRLQELYINSRNKNEI